MADRYYRVGPKFWTDNPHWTDDTRLAGLYILTCQHRTTEGLFRMPLEYACADLGWPMRKFRPVFDQLVRDEFIEYDHASGVLLIVKALKWQAPANKNQALGAVRALEGLPRTPLFMRFVGLAEAFSEYLPDALQKRWPKAFRKGIGKGVPNPIPNAVQDPDANPQSSTSKAPPPLEDGSTPEVGEARPPFAVIDGGAANVETDHTLGGTG